MIPLAQITFPSLLTMPVILLGTFLMLTTGSAAATAAIPTIASSCYMKNDGTDDPELKALYQRELKWKHNYTYCDAITSGQEQDLRAMLGAAKPDTLLLVSGHYSLGQGLDIPDQVTLASYDNCSATLASNDQFNNSYLIKLGNGARLTGFTIDSEKHNLKFPSTANVIITGDCPIGVSINANFIKAYFLSADGIRISCSSGNDPVQKFKNNLVENNLILVAGSASSGVFMSNYRSQHAKKPAVTVNNNKLILTSTTGNGIIVGDHGPWTVSHNTMDFSSSTSSGTPSAILKNRGAGIKFSHLGDVAVSSTLTDISGNSVLGKGTSTYVCGLYLDGVEQVKISDNSFNVRNALCYDFDNDIATGSDGNDWNGILYHHYCKQDSSEGSITGKVCGNSGDCCPAKSITPPTNPVTTFGATLPANVRRQCTVPTTTQATTTAATSFTTMIKDPASKAAVKKAEGNNAEGNNAGLIAGATVGAAVPVAVAIGIIIYYKFFRKMTALVSLDNPMHGMQKKSVAVAKNIPSSSAKVGIHCSWWIPAFAGMTEGW